MADIRINSLPTTASASSSDDFLALDGATNGTRKLNAYSPTFGGNLTVTGTSALGDTTGGVFYQASLNSNNQGTGVRLLNNNAGSRNWYIGSQNNVGNAVEITPSTANNGTTFSTPVWQISSAGNVTQTGNLTVSGTGNSSIAGNLLFPVNKYVYFDGSGAAQTAVIGVPTGTNDLNIGNNNALLVLERVSGESYFKVGGTEKLRVGASATTLSGNLTVSGTGTTALGGAGSIISLSSSGRLQLGFTYSRVADPDGAGGWLGGYNIKFSTSPKYDATGATAGLYYSSNGVRIYSGGTAVADTAAPLVATFATNGNFLLGTTTDSGQKLQVAGTGLFSTTEPTITLSSTAAGSIAYQLISGGGSGHTLGAFKIYDSSTGYVVLNHDKPTSGGTRLSFDGAGNATFAGDVLVQKSTPLLRLNNTGSGAGNWVHTITAATGEYRIGEYGIGDYIIINKTSGQIDFYKLFRPQQAATASAPTYVKGAIYFDTTLNKLCVGGATGWETITST